MNPWPRDTGAMLYQLSYEATDVGRRSIVGSYVQNSVGRASHRYREVTGHFISAAHIWFISHIINNLETKRSYKKKVNLKSGLKIIR